MSGKTEFTFVFWKKKSSGVIQGWFIKDLPNNYYNHNNLE